MRRSARVAAQGWPGCASAPGLLGGRLEAGRGQQGFVVRAFLPSAP